ncbi:fungal zinc cluster transcription factor [Colletotrichum higginsianum]|nr:fungal zinc cluster transcription factor [Colletotrichum higginsianum]
MVTNRIRVVEGSCWPCKKRRIKCDLTKPCCDRCSKIGAHCDFNARRLKWNTRPTTKAPVIYQIATRDGQLAASLASDERRALDYFHHRLWPLLTTARNHAPPRFCRRSSTAWCSSQRASSPTPTASSRTGGTAATSSG